LFSEPDFGMTAITSRFSGWSCALTRFLEARDLCVLSKVTRADHQTVNNLWQRCGERMGVHSPSRSNVACTPITTTTMPTVAQVLRDPQSHDTSLVEYARGLALRDIETYLQGHGAEGASIGFEYAQEEGLPQYTQVSFSRPSWSTIEILCCVPARSRAASILQSIAVSLGINPHEITSHRSRSTFLPVQGNTSILLQILLAMGEEPTAYMLVSEASQALQVMSMWFALDIAPTLELLCVSHSFPAELDEQPVFQQYRDRIRTRLL
jgi:hypothetical protein